MTSTDKLREAVARIIDPDAYTANNAWFILSAREEADRIIRMVVDACAREAETCLVRDFERKTGQTRVNSEAEIFIAARIRDLAPKEPAP